MTRRTRELLKQAAFVAGITLSTSAFATGNPGTQGPRFLGAGLEQDQQMDDGSSWPVGLQYYQMLPGKAFPPRSEADLTSPTWAFSPPPNGILVNSPSSTFTLQKLSCEPSGNPPTGSPYVAYCRAHVTGAFTQTGYVCDEANPTQHKVELVAISVASIDGTGVLNFAHSAATQTKVVFACAFSKPIANPGPSTDKDKIGAYGKCINWGFMPVPGSTHKFMACVHAVRADYCGNGYSYTEPGTPLTIYDSGGSSNPAVSLCQPGECFEASWAGSKGAICLNHMRYESLLVAATNSGPTRDAGVPQPPGVGGEADGLYVCTGQYNPLAQCLSQFTDLYYDDAHRIYPAQANIVNTVTAQYVCRTGSIRTNQGGEIYTRTKVRFQNTQPKSGGPGVDILDCCDTLACP